MLLWQPLYANLALAAMVLVAWSAVGDGVSRLRPDLQRILFGVWMAAGTIASMMLSFEIAPGVFFDLRGPLIASAGFFGGPLAAVVTGVVAIAYRVTLGGAVMSGLIGIALAVGIGVVGHAVHRSRSIQFADVGALASFMALSGTLVVWTLPVETREIILKYLWATVSMSFIGTFLLGILLLQEHRRRILSTSNRLYRSMVDALPDCLNIKDLDGRFLAANPATAALMKATGPAELIGRTDFDFFPKNVAERFREDELAIVRANEHATIEQKSEFPDGTSGWLSTLKAPLRDEAGNILGLITHNRDMTVQKLLQLRLAEIQACLDQALENMTDGLAMYDPQGRIVFCNSRYRQLFPATGHLRMAGSDFAEIVRQSITLGEEKPIAGLSVHEHVARKLAELRKDGEAMIELGNGRSYSSRTKVLDDGSSVRVISDVTERRQFERDLEHQALHDPLTALPNRKLFNRTLANMLEASRSTGAELVVMLVDLDHFKQVNDSFGHAIGDKLLVEVSRRLEAAVRRGDFVARLGGDEFAVLMLGPFDEKRQASLARRIIAQLSQPLQLADVTLLPGGTIGYTIFPKDNSDAEGLLKNADQALYDAKSRRRGTWAAFDPHAKAAGASARSA